MKKSTAVSYWLFVVKDEESERQLRNGYWRLFPTTPNRKSIKRGDRVVFYRAGENKQFFWGYGKIREINNLLIKLENVKIWDSPLPIRYVIKRLSFIKNKESWGVHLQGGIRKISEKDYRLILNLARSLGIKTTSK